jgi:hypothetical protein
MFKGDWSSRIALGVAYLALLVIAFGASIGLTLNGYAQLQKAYSTYQVTADSDREASANKIESSCFNADRAKFSECLRGEITSYYQKQATNQDLQAQQDMAFWAKALFILGIGQSVLSGLGIYFVLRTLSATREANEIAKNTANRQLRAYIGYSGCKMTRTNDFFYIEVCLTNFGQTPADIRGWLVQTYFMQGDKTFASGGSGGGPIILLPNSSATFTVGGMQMPTDRVVGNRIWINVKVLFIFNDIYEQTTKTSLELHSRQFLAEPRMADPSQVVFDLRLQSNTIHDQNLANGIRLMLQEADEKEARQNQQPT